MITLRRPNSAFLGALSLTAFGMQSPAAMAKYGANKGTLSKDGVFTPGGQYGVPGGFAVGTGPFKLESWKIGDKLVIVRNDSYWGKKAILRRVIFRAIPDNAARLQALQTGEIQGYDLVEPQDIPTVQKDSKLKVLDRPAFNVAYVTINQAVKPFDNPLVRQAVAYGLDRAGVVKSFYAGRGTVADEFMPPEVVGYSKTVPKYTYNPEKAKQLLQQAGLTLPGRGGVLVPDGRLASVHAGSGTELPGVRREPRQVGLQGDSEERSVAARLRVPRPVGHRRGPQPDRVDG